MRRGDRFVSGRIFAVSAASVLSATVVLCLILVGPGASRAASSPTTTVSGEGCAAGFGSLLFSYGPGEKVLSETDIPVCIRGDVVVTFSGAHSAGCQDRGLCGYSGTDTWNPAGEGDVTLLNLVAHHRRSTSATLLTAFGTPVSSVVQRSTSAGQVGTCRDRLRSNNPFAALPIEHGDVIVGVKEALFDTRCAGPLGVDLAGGLPRQSVSLTELRRGDVSISLAGSAPFHGGGFSGTVASTLTLALGHPQTQPVPRSRPEPSTGTGARLTTVTYRIARLTGEATADFRAPDARACAALDACGLHGKVSTRPHAGATGTAFLTAFTSPRRPQRDVLTALGLQTGGRVGGIDLFGAGSLNTGGTISETTSGQAARCTDEVELSQMAVSLSEQGGGLMVSLSPLVASADDPLRTRCPGPTLASHQLTKTSLPLSTLRQQRFTVRFQGVSYMNPPYSVTSQSTLAITFQRVRVRTSTFPAA